MTALSRQSQASGASAVRTDRAPGLRSRLASVRRKLRRFLDGKLHPLRRRRALARLRGRLPPRRVVVLCLGNACRSPYAEAYLREHGADLRLEVESAGFLHPGRRVPEIAREAARRRGLGTGEHTSQLVSRSLVRSADLLLLMDPGHLGRLRRELGWVTTPVVVLGDVDPETGHPRPLSDPWGGGPEEFHATFERIERCLDVLLAEWRRIV